MSEIKGVVSIVERKSNRDLPHTIREGLTMLSPNAKEVSMKPGISSSVVGDATKSKAFWTPEPWQVIRNGYVIDISTEGAKIGDPIAKVIARCRSFNPNVTEKEARTNAARIVAAVNAVAGIPTEELVRVGFGGLATLYADKYRNNA